MCRFNLILTNDEKAIRILEKNGYHKMFESVNEYAAYQKGYCNCGSCVGGLIEKKGRTFEESIAEVKTERLKRLHQIKEFMNQPGYAEQREIYTRTIEDLFQAMLHRPQEDITEQNSEYQASDEVLRKYQLRNELMQESLCYYRSEEEENAKKCTGIPLNQIVEELDLPNMTSKEAFLENVIEPIMEPESFAIDAVITRCEKNDYQSYRDEFEEYNRLFHELLEEVPDIIFTTIWSEPNNIQLVKTIPLDSFQIEELVYLNYDEMLMIQGIRYG